jgi:L-ribulose-5-phosphate 3-epimerase
MKKGTWSFGLFSWFGYQRPFEVKLDLIKAAGFDAICSWWGDSFMDLDAPNQAHARLARQRGLTLENAHLPYEDSDDLWQDSPAGQVLVDRIEEAIAEAAQAGIPTLVIHPYRTSQVLSQGHRSLFFQRAQRLGEKAHGLGMRLAWENLYDSRLVGEMMAALAHQPATGFCLDTGHANISQDGALSLLSDFPDKLFALHLHDNDGISDQHLLPGQGTFPWPHFMDLLARTGYQGALMLESAYPYDEARAAALGYPDYLEPALPLESYLDQAIRACRWLAEDL